MKTARLLTIYILVGLLYACGSEDDTSGEDKDDGTVKQDTTNLDTMAVDTAAMDTLAGEEVNMDSIEVEVKEASTAEKMETGVDGKSEAAEAVFKRFDLSDYGYNISISLPEATKITTNDFDEAVLTFGNDFILEVGENYDGPKEEVKKRFKGNVHNQLMGYIVEDDNGFVRKIKSNGVISHNLFYTINDGNMDLTVKSPMGQAYSQDEVLVMWKACKTLKTIE